MTVHSSELFDSIAAVPLRADLVDMANHSLYRWFAKAATTDVAELRAFHEHIFEYVRTGRRFPYLVAFTQDFPRMFDWFGRDIDKCSKRSPISS